ncbi:MAG: mitochondrial fission ELM1 family protein [Rickettsiaceae bacterium]|nr:mitochondrial fission ELM1 family protein [Rickettsiaceae bacterium]
MMADIWVLSDSKTGSTVQAVALAEKLSMTFEIKKLEYNLWALLPNFILGSTEIHLKSTSSDLTSDIPPKIIISSGRRTAPVALSIKDRYPEVKVIQIMKPFLAPSKFDLIILPQHDKFTDNGGKIMTIIGSLHNIKSKLRDAKGTIKSSNPHLQNFIAVLIGGDTKKYKFTEEEAQRLAKQINAISINHGINVFVSFSRRTSDKVKNIIRQEFQWPHVVYDPVSSSDPNPYYGMLSDADFIIATCDSVSMCSEASASGKPLYIFHSNDKNMHKHRYFAQQLVDLGVAKFLTRDIETLETYEYDPFDEAEKVSDYIKEQIL